MIYTTMVEPLQDMNTTPTPMSTFSVTTPLIKETHPRVVDDTSD
jgi:hypothetical protein